MSRSQFETLALSGELIFFGFLFLILFTIYFTLVCSETNARTICNKTFHVYVR